MFPSACPNRFFVKFSTTYLTDIAFGQLLSLLLHLPLFFSNKEREREKIAIERSNRMEAERKEGRNFGESDKRTGEKEEEQKRGGGRAKRVKKEGERIACVSYRLRASSHLRACTHSRGHLSRTHTPSLFLSLFIFIFLRRVTIIRNERERERGEKKGIASARISLLKSRKNVGFSRNEANVSPRSS